MKNRIWNAILTIIIGAAWIIPAASCAPNRATDLTRIRDIRAGRTMHIQGRTGLIVDSQSTATTYVFTFRDDFGDITLVRNDVKPTLGATYDVIGQVSAPDSPINVEGSRYKGLVVDAKTMTLTYPSANWVL